MPDCDYCSASFDDEGAYLDHLAADHGGELGTIDQRRIAEHTDADGEGAISLGPVILVGLVSVALTVVLYLTFFAGGGGGGDLSGESGVVTAGPGPDIQVEHMPGRAKASLDYHGTITVRIAGEQIDFSKERYQDNAGQFHFERGDGRIWHGHANGITLEYAMATVGLDINETAVTFNGTTYRDSDPNTEVRILINGDAVDPQTYVLEGKRQNPDEGDTIRIVVDTQSESN